MGRLKKVFGLQSSQGTKAVCDVPKSENESEDKKEDDNPQISKLKIEESSQQSSQDCQGTESSWFSSWSGLSTTFDSPKSKKREFSDEDEEEDKW